MYEYALTAWTADGEILGPCIDTRMDTRAY